MHLKYQQVNEKRGFIIVVISIFNSKSMYYITHFNVILYYIKYLLQDLLQSLSFFFSMSLIYFF